MVQARATQVQTAYSIERHGAWGAFLQMLFTSVKLQGGYGVGHAHGTRSHGADSFLVSRGVRNTLRSMCVLCVGRGDNVCKAVK